MLVYACLIVSRVDNLFGARSSTSLSINPAALTHNFLIDSSSLSMCVLFLFFEVVNALREIVWYELIWKDIRTELLKNWTDKWWINNEDQLKKKNKSYSASL